MLSRRQSLWTPLLLLLCNSCSVDFARGFSATTSRGPPPKDIHLLILPGFGNDQVDYIASPSVSFVESLQKRGWSEEQIHVLPVQRSDWIRVFARGLVDWQFWQGTLTADRPPFRWYLQAMADAIQEIDSNHKNSRVVLLGHSAGGWLARASLGYGQPTDADTDEDEEPEDELAIDLSNVLGLVTLGTPHLAPPPEVMDMTRGALRTTDEKFPGAYHQPDLFYLTVIGTALLGVQQQKESMFEATTATGQAYVSYEAVCGVGTTIGDGIVPRVSAHLEGADQQLNLDGVYHSIGTPVSEERISFHIKSSVAQLNSQDQWYGADAVLDRWHNAMLDEIERAARPASSLNLFGSSFRR